MVNIFVAEIITSPLLRIIDIPGFLKKHIIAPRLKSEATMIRMFSGVKVSLAERYTEINKVVFLCFYYATILPTGFFFGAFAFMVYYQVDKFCLVRSWGRISRLDKQIAQFQRMYFLWTALIVFVIMSAYMYSAFPFDNLCESKDKEEYRFCNQDMFPPLPRQQTAEKEWMSKTQALIVYMHSNVAIALLCFGIFSSFCLSLPSIYDTLVRGSYEEFGEVQGKNFSDIPSIFAYIPQVSVSSFIFPLIACDISQVNVENIYWKNPDISHDHYCIVNDVPEEEIVLKGKTKQNYSVVRYYS